MTISWARGIALLLMGLVALLLTSCAKEEEPAPVADYSSPIAGEQTPAPPSDYSSPLSTGEPSSEAAETPPANTEPPAETEPPEEPRGPHTEPVTAAEAPKVQVVSHGKEIMVEHYIVPGKLTIFDFYSDYCPPCIEIAPYLEKLVNQREDLYLVKVDINREGVQGIDWGSPVSMQFTLRSIPHFKIYGPTGKLMLEGDPAFRRIIEWLKEIEEPSQ